MNWPEHSDEWRRFIDNPIFEDVIRIGNRLGLHRLLWDTDNRCWLSNHPNSFGREPTLNHPGVVIFLLESLKTFHCIFNPDLRFDTQLPGQYTDFRPQLIFAMTDERRSSDEAAYAANTAT